MEEHDCREIGFLIKIISDSHKTLADADMKQYDLTFSQGRVLHFIGDQGGQATQKQIEGYLGVAHPTVVGLVARLAKNGFIDCEPDPTNRRQKLVKLTDKAREVGHTMEQGRIKRNAAMLEGFSQEEENELQRLLLKVVDNLKKEKE